MDANNKVFARIFLWWRESEDFKKELNYRNSGKSIAVLKTVITIALFSDFHTRISRISFSELEEITGLSRPMIAFAIEWIEGKKWIEVTKNKGFSNRYLLIDYKDKMKKYSKEEGWTKLPFFQIYTCLRKLPNKGSKGLTAIKNYLLILFQRDSAVDFSRISHEKLALYGNTLPKLIKGGNDLLLSANLIGYARYVSYEGNLITSYNLYHVKGLYYGKRGQTQQYADHIDYIKESSNHANRVIYTANGGDIKVKVRDLPF